MRRRWSARHFVDRCQLVKDSLDRPALTTDVIVGFPGETDEDFAATEDVVRTVGFSKLHLFSFSARRTTPAATMEGQVPPAQVAQRYARLRAVEQDLHRAYLHRLIGEPMQVLLEGAGDTPGSMLGTACRYAAVELPGRLEERGQLVSARAVSVANDRLLAARL
jgi:threonylcarbamoyladenosine tRNA methylthiotransferase MtaB